MAFPDRRQTGQTGQGGTGSGNRGGTDDVSLNRSGSQGRSSGAEGLMNSAEDALGQLQSKASELTSRLIDNIDVDDLTQKLETQVREHPTRTLMVALGAGFLLGRAVKK